MLGVPRTASTNDIKKAYRALAARYHPDKHRGNELEDLAKEKLTQLNEAYETLKDSDRRAEYDSRLHGQSPFPTGTRYGPQPNMTGALRSVVRTLLVIAVVFLTLRFVRSPRAIAVIGVVLLLSWFLPRVIRKLRRKK